MQQGHAAYAVPRATRGSALCNASLVAATRLAIAPLVYAQVNKNIASHAAACSHPSQTAEEGVLINRHHICMECNMGAP